MLSSGEIISFLRSNKAYLQERFHCTEIGLFGSYARNEQTEKSDIDFLVVFEPNTPNLYDTELELKNFLQTKFGRQVDICAKKWINPIFKNRILKDALYA
ncbi:nucleotidyltransferase family protein [Mangrovibacterium marinum]|uniref:nucleotidyltransferase family protein n=1 Tax=Mangrovibacterium marinum TaxID=1639118 RepID=UPI0038B29968